jgi:hypothetical protein
LSTCGNFILPRLQNGFKFGAKRMVIPFTSDNPWLVIFSLALKSLSKNQSNR